MHWTDKRLAELKAKGRIRSSSDKKLPAKKKDQYSSKSKIAFYSLVTQWASDNGYRLELEYKFDKSRGWRFDCCLPDLMVAVEYEGGIFMGKSGHNTAKHYTKDTEKYNQAAVLGYRVLRFTAMNYKDVRKTLDKILNSN